MRWMYCVVVGDIIQSRKMEEERDRESNRRKIEEIFNQINTEYLGDILSEFGIVRGDAFEGVLYSAVVATDIVQELIIAFWEKCRLFIRVAIVSDRLSTFQLDRNKSDGPAFIKATKGIDQLKHQRKSHWIQVYYEDALKDMTVTNSLTRMIGALTKDWTDKQKIIAFLMPQCNDNQTAVAEELSVRIPAVNKQIASIDYYSFRDAWNSIKRELEKEEKERAGDTEIFFVERYGYARNLLKKQGEDILCSLNQAEKQFEDAYVLAADHFGDDDIRTLPFLNGLLECYLMQINSFHYEKNYLTNLNNVLKERFRTAEKLDNNPEKTMEHARMRLLKGDWYRQRDEWNKAIEEYESANEYLMQFYGMDHPMRKMVKKRVAECNDAQLPCSNDSQSDRSMQTAVASMNATKKRKHTLQVSWESLPGRRTYSQRTEDGQQGSGEEEEQ